MEIAASLRLLRRMHSPSCTYSPRRRDSTNFFSLEGGGACLSVTIYSHRPDPERTGRSRLSTGRNLYRTRVRSTYSVQCTVHSTYFIIVTDTALPPPAWRIGRPDPTRKKKIVISCQLSDVFQPVDYLLISMHQ